MANHNGTRWRGKLPIPERVDPAVAELYRLLNEEKTTVSEVAVRAGLRRGSISDWRYRRCPTVANLRAVLNAFGYDLAVMPMEGV